MLWLLGCQRSGLLRELLRAQGHEAYTCDLEPAEDGSPYHLQFSILDAINIAQWDRMIAMPECRYLCSSGMHRTGKPGQRTVGDVEAAAEFFMKLINAPIEKIAIENSIGIMSTRYRKPDQIIDPHEFGEDAKKSTCLWLKGFPKLVAMNHIPPRWVNGLPRWANQTDSGQNRLGPSPTRSMDRARTYPGIAAAMGQFITRRLYKITVALF